MPPRGIRIALLLDLLLSLSLTAPALAQPSQSLPVLIVRDDAAPVPVNPVPDLTFLPAQIGGIVGAYAVSLVLVAITLLALSKKRRQHLSAGTEEVDFEARLRQELASPDFPPPAIGGLSLITPSNPGFTYPNISEYDLSAGTKYVSPTPTSATTVGAPGVDRHVDQKVVLADRLVAQSQLETMFKHVLEQEDAKKRGVTYESPVMPNGSIYSQPQSPAAASFKSSGTVISKKERSKPANLNLEATREEKTQSRASSLLSALRSPKKKSMKGINISSPIMTPKSATFPRQESQEMNPIPPRHYAPAVPPPVPTDQIPYGAAPIKHQAPLTPDISPESVMSIDERIGSQLPPLGHTRTTSNAPTEGDPQSAVSDHSQAPLVGLPASPRAANFALPASPKPGATFQRSKAAPSAVRTGGALPFRAYESSLASPTTIGQTTKQTVFERKGPLSPSGAMTPFTAGAVPYSPYQPFTPCVPVTPSLVTKHDRKKMRRMVPKTPTMDMVRSEEDVW